MSIDYNFVDYVFEVLGGYTPFVVTVVKMDEHTRGMTSFSQKIKGNSFIKLRERELTGTKLNSPTNDKLEKIIFKS